MAAQFCGGGGFGGVFLGTSDFPNQFAEGEGDFTFAGFVGEEVGVEAIQGQVLQGFPGEGRGERWFAPMGGLFGDFGMPCLIKFGIGEIFGTVPEALVGWFLTICQVKCSIVYYTLA